MAFKLPRIESKRPNKITFVENGETKVYEFYQKEGKSYMSIDGKELPFSVKLHEKTVDNLLKNPNITIL